MPTTHHSGGRYLVNEHLLQFSRPCNVRPLQLIEERVSFAAVLVSGLIIICIRVGITITGNALRGRAQRNALFKIQDENENCCLPISCFETKAGFTFFQSCASIRKTEICSFYFMLRKGNENGFFFKFTLDDENEKILS